MLRSLFEQVTQVGSLLQSLSMADRPATQCWAYVRRHEHVGPWAWHQCGLLMCRSSILALTCSRRGGISDDSLHLNSFALCHTCDEADPAMRLTP